MEITQKQVDAAYAVASPEQKKVLDALFGKEEAKKNIPVTERIKTFEDAVRELGETHDLVVAYRAVIEMWKEEFLGRDMVAYLKLRIIVAALNEGWEPKFVEDERRWAPYFWLFTNAEIEKMDDNDKAKLCRVVGRSYNIAHAYGGLVYTGANLASSYSYTSSGSRLAFKSEELAVYAGQQFIEIYRDFMIQLHE
jgi:hypothetical protein